MGRQVSRLRGDIREGLECEDKQLIFYSAKYKWPRGDLGTIE